MTGILRTIDDLHAFVWSFAGHRVLTVASRTGILNRLARAGATTAELARELGLDRLATGKIVRALTALGLVESTGSTYALCDPFGSLFAEGPDDFTPFLVHSHHLYDRWGENLEAWLKGESWSTKKRTREQILQFGRGMQAMAQVLADQVVRAVDLSGVERMLDVGGGLGAYTSAFCRKKPGIRATVLDTEEVAEMGRAEVLGTDVEDWIDFEGGDYLETEYGTGYDLVLFANVLHQELPEQAASLVRRGADSLNPNGIVAVVDFSIDDEQRQHLVGALFAINMRSFGDTYPEPVIRQWMEQAGLDRVARTDLTPNRWLITGRKPG